MTDKDREIEHLRRLLQEKVALCDRYHAMMLKTLERLRLIDSKAREIVEKMEELSEMNQST